MAEDTPNIYNAYLEAAKVEFEHAVNKLKRRIVILEEENRLLGEFGERMAADKLQLTKQRDHLVERILFLEKATSEPA